MQTALELYYDTNKQYPPRGYVYSYYAGSSGDPQCGYQWCLLETALAPFIPNLPRDPIASDSWRYHYDADSGDNYQSYGLMVRLEDSANFKYSQNDGGSYANSYEVGPQPKYCTDTYGTDVSVGNWWGGQTSGSITLVCSGGN